MSKEEILRLKHERLNRLENSPKNLKCQGVKKKLIRQIKNLENN